jgi:biopolymer transport protein ExbD
MAAKVGGGNKGKFNLGQNADINVTPFVDVMLVLLIIFMVTAPLATVSIRLDLPPAVPPKDPTKQKPPTVISIQDTGRIYVTMGETGLKETRLENLSLDLAASLQSANPTQERVFIRAEKHVRYRLFMDVINQLQTDGFFKIGLVSEEV